MAVRLLPGPFTVDAYHRLAELGILDEDDRVELLDGQIVEMTPIGGAHAACVIRLTDLLSRRPARGISVSVQNPVVLAERWEPQPDLVGDVIKLCRRPGPDGYGEIVTVSRGQALRPLLLPEVALTAVEILG